MFMYFVMLMYFAMFMYFAIFMHWKFYRKRMIVLVYFFLKSHIDIDIFMIIFLSLLYFVFNQCID